MRCQPVVSVFKPGTFSVVLRVVHEGGIATGTVINEKGWQAIKSGAVATDTVVNTGAEGGPDAENGDTGQTVYGDAVRTTINKNGRQIVAAEGTANTTVVYAGGDQTVHGHALDTTLNGGYQMLPGYFRFVCQNGCVCGQSLGEVRVPHRGNVVEKVIEGAYEVVGFLTGLRKSVMPCSRWSCRHRHARRWHRRH
ncbi:Antigen 43 [Escherichia coli]|nr:Antigen 43 [Escherichia coli]